MKKILIQEKSMEVLANVKPLRNEDGFAAADAAWDALPGTRPNAYGFRSNDELRGRDVGQEIAAVIATLGGKFHRATRTNDGLWVEAWDERPRKQADFDPPYTLMKPSSDVEGVDVNTPPPANLS